MAVRCCNFNIVKSAPAVLITTLLTLFNRKKCSAFGVPTNFDKSHFFWRKCWWVNIVADSLAILACGCLGFFFFFFPFLIFLVNLGTFELWIIYFSFSQCPLVILTQKIIIEAVFTSIYLWPFHLVFIVVSEWINLVHFTSWGKVYVMKWVPF